MGAALGAGLGIVGDLASGIMENAFAKHAANRSFRRQKSLMRSAHQMEVADLRAAGLNPILSATGGPGAGGFNVPMQATPDFALDVAAQRGISSAKEASLLSSNVKTAQANASSAESAAEIADVYAEGALPMWHADIGEKLWRAASFERDTFVKDSQRRLNNATSQMLEFKMPGARAESALDQTEFGELLRKVNRAMDAITPFKGFKR